MLGLGSTHAAASAVATFTASAVECVEAMTVILAVGNVRGWRGAIEGSVAGLVLLGLFVAILGPALTRVPVTDLQLAAGILLLLFGMRWLRKAILRRAGAIPLRDEAAAFAAQTSRLATLGHASGHDVVAVTTSFQIVMIEGLEVIFIVLATAAGGTALLRPAIAGAVAALVLVVAIGFAIHRPLTRVPENTLKFIVGVLISAFGTFWTGEGLGVAWPGADWSLVALTGGFLAIALLLAEIGRVSLVRVTP